MKSNPKDWPCISFTFKEFNAFKKEYEKVKDNKDFIFDFKGHKFLVGYAKYLIQYLEGRFKK